MLIPTSLWTAWIALIPGGLGKMIKGMNREDDVGAQIFSDKLWVSNVQEEDELIKKLLKAFTQYNDNLSYSPFPNEIPGTSGTYNSNSFIRGLLDYAGIPLPNIFHYYEGTLMFPGINKPIPLAP
jgi:hypothetical protein